MSKITYKDITLWSRPEAKFKPRNLQAARVTFPAKGLHLPPEFMKGPTFAVPLAEVLRLRQAEIEKRIAAVYDKFGPPQPPSKARKGPRLKHPKKCKSNFASKQNKKIAKMTAKAAAAVALKVSKP